jgi:hypothetical protein
MIASAAAAPDHASARGARFATNSANLSASPNRRACGSASIAALSLSKARVEGAPRLSLSSSVPAHYSITSW